MFQARRISLKQKFPKKSYQYYKTIISVLSAGTPLETSLMLLSQQAKSKFTNVLLEINDDITEGKGLSESMKKFPQIFDDIYTQLFLQGKVLLHYQKFLMIWRPILIKKQKLGQR